MTKYDHKWISLPVIGTDIVHSLNCCRDDLQAAWDHPFQNGPGSGCYVRTGGLKLFQTNCSGGLNDSGFGSAVLNKAVVNLNLFKFGFKEAIRYNTCSVVSLHCGPHLPCFMQVREVLLPVTRFVIAVCCTVGLLHELRKLPKNPRHPGDTGLSCLQVNNGHSANEHYGTLLNINSCKQHWNILKRVTHNVLTGLADVVLYWQQPCRRSPRVNKWPVSFLCVCVCVRGW